MPVSACTSKARSGLSGLQESQHDVDLQAEAREARANREVRLIRLNRILEHHVEHALLPVDLGALIELGAGRDVGERGVVAFERSIRRQRGARRRDHRHGQLLPVLVDLDEIADPDLRGVALGGFHLRKIEESAGHGRNVDVAHRLEGRPDQQAERLALGMHESEDGDLVGDLVGG